MKTPSNRRGKDRSLRRHIVQEAARLMANQECFDFQSARRRAAERLGCKDQRQLPDNREIEMALRDYQQLFKGETQPDALRYLRRIAVEAMENLQTFSPRLIGAVLNGTADTTSPVQLYLFAETPDDIKLHLMARSIPHTQRDVRLHYSGGTAKTHPVFDFWAGEAAIELIVLTFEERSNPPLNPVDDRPDPGATLNQIRSLLA